MFGRARRRRAVAFAVEWATAWDKDPRVVEVVLRESMRIVRQIGPVLITETRHGFVCANSGVDQSSSGAPVGCSRSRSIPTPRLAGCGADSPTSASTSP